jgi:outer membrane lipoprotein-sorting protein
MAILCFVFQATPEEPVSQKSPIPEKDQVFEQIAIAASSIETLASGFTQENHSAMLKDVPVSKGRFYYKTPDGLRWEVLEPNPLGFIVNGDRAKRWRGQSDHSQSFDIRREPVVRIITDQVFAWARADFKWLEERYVITVVGDAPVVLKLVPVSSSEKKYVDHIRLIFSETDAHMSEVEIRETGGDYTVIRFINTVVNSPLEGNLFD